jgi:hypothetical protein
MNSRKRWIGEMETFFLSLTDPHRDFIPDQNIKYLVERKATELINVTKQLMCQVEEMKAKIEQLNEENNFQMHQSVACVKYAQDCVSEYEKMKAEKGLLIDTIKEVMDDLPPDLRALCERTLKVVPNE